MHVLTTLHPPAHREDKNVHLHGIAVYLPSHVADGEVLAARTSVSGSGRQYPRYPLSSTLRRLSITPSDDSDGDQLADIEENNKGSGEQARL